MDDNTHIPHKASLPPVNLPTNGDAPIFEDMKKPEKKFSSPRSYKNKKISYAGNATSQNGVEWHVTTTSKI